MTAAAVPLRSGLYLVTRLKLPGVVHYGVLDVGNRLRAIGIASGAMVWHQHPTGLRVDPFQQHEWLVGARIVDEDGARNRLQAAKRSPLYDLFGNNCEHFARLIATGSRKSVQVGLAIGVATAVVLWLLFGRDN